MKAVTEPVVLVKQVAPEVTTAVIPVEKTPGGPGEYWIEAMPLADSRAQAMGTMAPSAGAEVALRRTSQPPVVVLKLAA
jgi:hypothetical protein